MKFQIKNLIIILSCMIVGVNIMAGTKPKQPTQTYRGPGTSVVRISYLRDLEKKIDTLLSKDISKPSDYAQWTKDIDALIKEMEEKPQFVLSPNLVKDIQKLKNIKFAYGKTPTEIEEATHSALENIKEGINQNPPTPSTEGFSVETVNALSEEFKAKLEEAKDNKAPLPYQEIAKKIASFEEEIGKLQDENEKSSLKSGLDKFKTNFTDNLVKTYVKKLNEIGTLAQRTVNEIFAKIVIDQNKTIERYLKGEEFFSKPGWLTGRAYGIEDLHKDSDKITKIVNLIFNDNSKLFSDENIKLLNNEQKPDLIDAIDKKINHSLNLLIAGYFNLAEQAAKAGVDKDIINKFLEIPSSDNRTPQLLQDFHKLVQLFENIDSKDEKTGMPHISKTYVNAGEGYPGLLQEWEELEKKLQ